MIAATGVLVAPSTQWFHAWESIGTSLQSGQAFVPEEQATS